MCLQAIVFFAGVTQKKYSEWFRGCRESCLQFCGHLGYQVSFWNVCWIFCQIMKYIQDNSGQGWRHILDITVITSSMSSTILPDHLMTWLVLTKMPFILVAPTHRFVSLLFRLYVNEFVFLVSELKLRIKVSNLITVQQDVTYSVYYISVGSSTCFGCWHPSSGACTAVITASGIDWPDLLLSALVVELELNPTRCDLFSLLHFCRQLYMFQVLTPIIRSSYNCNYSFWYWLTESTTIRSRRWVGTESNKMWLIQFITFL